jgi:hypothetical protein
VSFRCWCSDEIDKNRDVSRFSSPEKLSSYFGLTQKVKQSGSRPRVTVGSRNKETLPHAKCLSRRLGRQKRHLGHCALFLCAFRRCVARLRLPSRLRGSLPL